MTYALQIDADASNLPAFDSRNEALAAAFVSAQHGHTALVIWVVGEDEDLTFTPLAVVSPPPVGGTE